MTDWQLIILGEPCQRGTAATEEQAVEAARRALRERPDYSSILALARSGIGVDVRLTPAREHRPGG